MRKADEEPENEWDIKAFDSDLETQFGIYDVKILAFFEGEKQLLCVGGMFSYDREEEEKQQKF